MEKFRQVCSSSTDSCTELTSFDFTTAEQQFALIFFHKAHQRLLTAAFSEYSLANPLHSDLWPSIMKFEAEIVAMCAALVRGNNQHVCGCTTSVSEYSVQTNGFSVKLTLDLQDYCSLTS